MKWVLWGVFYSIPFATMTTYDTKIIYNGWFFGFALVQMVAAIIHALLARKEYLLRLEARQKAQVFEDMKLRSAISAEYGLEVTGIAKPVQPGPVSRSSSQIIVDINNAKEEALADLPGIGKILAKRATELRNIKGGFRSIEEFAHDLSLKPHIVERLRPIVSLTPIKTVEAVNLPQETINQGSSEFTESEFTELDPGKKGRVVDY